MDLAIESPIGVYVAGPMDCETQNKKLRFEAYLLKALGQAVIATDLHGKIIYWNYAAHDLVGWSEKEMVGKNILHVFGEIFLVSDPEVLSRLKSIAPWTGEVTVKKQNGEFLETIMAKRQIVDGEGRVFGVLGVLTDISNLKWMQQVMEEAVKAVAELNEKLHVVESLTRHDIRNKLAVLNGQLYLLKKRLDNYPDASLRLDAIGAVSKQMLNILDFERFYVQVGSEELTNVDVANYVEEAALLFSDLNGAKLVNGCHGLTVLADSLLRQLFYNLIDNTLKYGQKVNEIKVGFEEEKDQLRLIYEDDGVGVSDEAKTKLFTEGYGKGTGYGLYLIKRICEAYGWTIMETGIQGKGAQFTMVIPKYDLKGKKRYQIRSPDV
jgi:PAS domain S-box-containing protein